jgi:hypothetical protein
VSAIRLRITRKAVTRPGVWITGRGRRTGLMWDGVGESGCRLVNRNYSGWVTAPAARVQVVTPR